MVSRDVVYKSTQEYVEFGLKNEAGLKFGISAKF